VLDIEQSHSLTDATLVIARTTEGNASEYEGTVNGSLFRFRADKGEWKFELIETPMEAAASAKHPSLVHKVWNLSL
jgi:hypothetical protein